MHKNLFPYLGEVITWVKGWSQLSLGFFCLLEIVWSGWQWLRPSSLIVPVRAPVFHHTYVSDSQIQISILVLTPEFLTWASSCLLLDDLKRISCLSGLKQNSSFSSPDPLLVLCFSLSNSLTVHWAVPGRILEGIYPWLLDHLGFQYNLLN